MWFADHSLLALIQKSGIVVRRLAVCSVSLLHLLPEKKRLAYWQLAASST